MAATILDVAKRAGVSPGTVSNALSGKRPVSPATYQRIMHAIESLGYEPNLLARSLVNRKSGIISVVVTELSDLGFYGYVSTLAGIQQQATELGYSLMLHFVSGRGSDGVWNVLGEAKARRADGILWAIHEFDGNRNWIADLPGKKYPPIVHLNMHPEANSAVVSVDNRLGARLAVDHLIDRGSRKIGIITGPSGWWEAQERLAGWRESLTQAGIESPDSLIVEGNWLSDSGKAGIKVLLARHPDLEALFVGNDVMALGALYTLHSLGIRVPDDLLLVGFDNTPEAAAYWPPLTSVKQGLRHLGCLAVQELHRIVEANNTEQSPVAPTSRQLRPELVVRCSSTRGCAP